MKLYLIISIMIISGCRKDNNKSAAQNSLTTGNEITDEKPVPVTSYGSDSSYQKEGARSDLGYVQYGINKINSEIQYPGSIVAMAQWKDALGSNIVFVTETSENSNEDTRSKELYGFHYITDNSGNEQLWKINDFIKDCPVDLTLEYIKNSLNVTDLDKNGIGESSFLYKMSCKGDVSSDNLKLIMHERDKKYALRGSMNLVMNGRDLAKGSMTTDPAFNSAPDVFLDYAKSQWEKFKTERIGD